MTYIQERGSTHVYHVNRMSKEEMDHMISLCVHEQPAYCVAACPFKADTKEMLFYAAKGNFKKALAIEILCLCPPDNSEPFSPIIVFH